MHRFHDGARRPPGEDESSLHRLHDGSRRRPPGEDGRFLDRL